MRSFKWPQWGVLGLQSLNETVTWVLFNHHFAQWPRLWSLLWSLSKNHSECTLLSPYVTAICVYERENNWFMQMTETNLRIKYLWSNIAIGVYSAYSLNSWTLQTIFKSSYEPLAFLHKWIVCTVNTHSSILPIIKNQIQSCRYYTLRGKNDQVELGRNSVKNKIGVYKYIFNIVNKWMWNAFLLAVSIHGRKKFLANKKNTFLHYNTAAPIHPRPNTEDKSFWTILSLSIYSTLQLALILAGNVFKRKEKELHFN